MSDVMPPVLRAGRARCWELVALLSVVGVGITATPSRAWAVPGDVLPPQIVHEPCEYYKKGHRFVILARFYDDSAIFEPKVLYRSHGETNWRNAPFIKVAGSQNFKAVIKRRDLHGKLEYFIQAFDSNGNGPARYGSPDAPVVVKPSEHPPSCNQVGGPGIGPVQEEAPSAPLSKPSQKGASRSQPINATPASTHAMTATSGPTPPPARQGCNGPDASIVCSAWFWGGLALGAVAVAGGVVGGLYAAGVIGPGHTPSGPPDSVTLNITGANPTSAALRAGSP